MEVCVNAPMFFFFVTPKPVNVTDVRRKHEFEKEFSRKTSVGSV
jgi:hypothetical protein